MKKLLVVGVVVLGIAVGLCGGAGAVTYQAPIDLGPGIARAINNLGQAVGNNAYSFSYGAHAVLWENGSTVPTPLPYLPSPYNNWAQAMDINDQGQVAGESVMASTYQGQACLWENKTANPTPLGFLPDHDTSLAYGMNNAGQVVGGSTVYTNWDTWRAVLWQNDTIQNLGVLDAWPRSNASAINDLGVVVGGVGTSGGAQRATLWYGGVAGYLGEPAGHTRSGAVDINNLGDVVGSSGPSSGQSYACWWHAGVATNLHLDAPSEYQSGYSSASAINNSGQAVGWLLTNPSQGHQYEGRAYLWQNHSMQLLPLLDGYEYATAQGINDLGQIVGFAGDGYTESRAVLWNPVPEPSSLVALGSGLAGLGGVFFRRRRR